jgi:hypothetical protein
MPNLDWIDLQLKQFIRDRFGSFASVPLAELKTPSEAFCTISPLHLSFLSQYQDLVIRYLEQYQAEMLNFVCSQANAFFQSKNQFLLIEPQRNRLTAEYKRFLADFSHVLVSTKPSKQLPQTPRLTLRYQLQEMMATHHLQLEQFVNNLAVSNLSQDFVFSTPVCSYYAPELQLSILHTSPKSLLEPILDLGCGQGDLVHFLRSQGKQAFGIDRSDSTSSFLISTNWLDFGFAPQNWGTIISHMAFSNHFLHHYWRRGGNWQQCASLYMNILSSLKPQGRFLYAPGVPFIEALLPRQEYLVERFEISGTPETTKDEYLRLTSGLDALYACQVSRR